MKLKDPVQTVYQLIKAFLFYHGLGDLDREKAVFLEQDSDSYCFIIFFTQLKISSCAIEDTAPFILTSCWFSILVLPSVSCTIATRDGGRTLYCSSSSDPLN